MKLSSDAAVSRTTYGGITGFDTLIGFDKKSIEALPDICKNNIDAIAEDQTNEIAAEAAVNGATINSISVRRLIVATDIAKYYVSIDRELTIGNIHYTNFWLTSRLNGMHTLPSRNLISHLCQL